MVLHVARSINSIYYAKLSLLHCLLKIHVVEAVDRYARDVAAVRVSPEAVRCCMQHAEAHFFGLGLSPLTQQWWRDTDAARSTSYSVLGERYGKLLVSALLRHRSR